VRRLTILACVALLPVRPARLVRGALCRSAVRRMEAGVLFSIYKQRVFFFFIKSQKQLFLL
jgi:hypothetical protein